MSTCLEGKGWSKFHHGFRSIYDFTEVYEILKQYQNLQELNLQDNQITELP